MNQWNFNVKEKTISAQITFFGAAQTVTGSMHLLEINGLTILFDCGLYQGRRNVARQINENFPFDPSKINCMILSHAHIDHSGNIPNLVKQGFSGTIYATEATRDLCEIMLLDSAHIQKEDARYLNKKLRRKGLPQVEPLYDEKDVQKALSLFHPKHYKDPIQVSPSVRLTFLDAGHILGSSLVLLEVIDNAQEDQNLSICYTGDIGSRNRPIIRDPDKIPVVDVLITESTYGDRLHNDIENISDQLLNIVKRTYDRNGKIIIPAFSVGRTQTLVYYLHKLFQNGSLPPIPIYVDSPLSVNITEVYRKHIECYDKETLEYILHDTNPFGFRSLNYITDTEASKHLNSVKQPCIIISASGMCEYGRILHHLKNNITDSRNAILLVGYQAEHTLGRRLAEGEKKAKIFGEIYNVKAKVHMIDSLSSHADQNDFIHYYKDLAGVLQNVFIVHGEESQTTSMSTLLKDNNIFEHPIIPSRGQAYPI